MAAYVRKNEILPGEVILVSELERQLIGEGVRSSRGGRGISHRGNERNKRRTKNLDFETI
jgi:hypothetical protein